MRLPSLADFVRENVALQLPVEEGIACYVEQTLHKVDIFVPLSLRQEVKEEYTRGDLLKRDKLFASIKDFAAKVTALIDYDISKTGKTQGIFKKFCFHYRWLDALTEEAHKLCALERESLERAIADQARIRDWILRLVTRDAVSINYRVRSIFADANFESFSVRRKIEMAEFDKYRFYDLEDHLRLSLGSLEEEVPAAPAAAGHGPPAGPEDGDLGEEEQEKETGQGLRQLKQFVVEGPSVYEHIMAPEFQLQDKDLVTSNQLFNYNCKIRYYLNDPLKQEFNKLFHEAQQLKQDTIDSVMNTNAVLNKIYDNMNIMLRLLNMDQFQPPELTMPGLEQDEVIKRIMEVDDSEIKAGQPAETQDHRHGRQEGKTAAVEHRVLGSSPRRHDGRRAGEVVGGGDQEGHPRAGVRAEEAAARVQSRGAKDLPGLRGGSASPGAGPPQVPAHPARKRGENAGPEGRPHSETQSARGRADGHETEVRLCPETGPIASAHPRAEQFRPRPVAKAVQHVPQGHRQADRVYDAIRLSHGLLRQGLSGCQNATGGSANSRSDRRASVSQPVLAPGATCHPRNDQALQETAQAARQDLQLDAHLHGGREQAEWQAQPSHTIPIGRRCPRVPQLPGRVRPAQTVSPAGGRQVLGHLRQAATPEDGERAADQGHWIPAARQPDLLECPRQGPRGAQGVQGVDAAQCRGEHPNLRKFRVRWVFNIYIYIKFKFYRLLSQLTALQMQL
ncbi:hypothetical protein M5D96_005713 [Drosophila gunungcola]|uniref:Uncharacterized protein n=1 Tax=Drosophila gunungcola TaxID=103775 RepID=A0A9P9YQT3_9MUSC|nr:hypothetical protein M5D96_005713 [Drosophila gunungcola]